MILINPVKLETNRSKGNIRRFLRFYLDFSLQIPVFSKHLSFMFCIFRVLLIRQEMVIIKSETGKLVLFIHWTSKKDVLLLWWLLKGVFIDSKFDLLTWILGN